MAVLPYRVPWWLPGGHLQTFYTISSSIRAA